MAIAAVSCSSPEKMAEQAENVIVTCNPEVLEVVGGVIDATVTVTYPEKYFHEKAIVEVTPVIVYDGGESKMEPYMFQGEKVEDNYEVVSSDGATISKPVHFEYVEGMENCYLELRGVASYKGKSIDLPTKKVADGANTTYMLVCRKGKVDLKEDGYQDVITETAEGQILYSINSSEVKSSEIKGESVKGFQNAIDEINANERKTITGTQIVAYASPDGDEDFNANLSSGRASSAQKAFDKVTKGKEIAAPEVSSIAEDWDGFQELVGASDIEDKDLILRVLSMYSDPAVREKEIRNMSAVYKTLSTDVLPELRRARFIANVEYQNFTSEELLEMVEGNADILDEAALLRAATLVEKTSDKVALYKKAIDKFDSNTARYNLAVTYINDGDYGKAKKQLEELEADADVNNALGVIALNEDNVAEAVEYFKKSGNASANENLGIVSILKGDYKDAASRLANSECAVNKALANILTDNLAAAKSALTCDCPKASYLKAVIAAREGDAAAVKENLDKAKEDKKLAKRAENDIEFAQYL